jgi:hypothetical protein
MTVHSPIPETARDVVRKLRVAVFIEHDIIYRHFVQSRVFRRLQAEHDVTYVFAKRGPGNKRLRVEPEPAHVGTAYVDIPVDEKRQALWRRLFQVSQFIWRPGKRWAQIRATATYLVGPRASKLYRVLALPGIFQIYSAYTRIAVDRRPSSIGECLDELRPDVILHPTVLDGYFISDLILEGRRRKIPTVCVMNSWDNPSTKRSAVGKPDLLLVWGAQTREHAIEFMRMQPDHVVPFGAAQFEIFREPPRESRAGFCARLNIDPSHPILLYAGSSKGADEFAHLCKIEAAIDQGDLQPMTAVYRPHPWRHVRLDPSMTGYLSELREVTNRIHLPDYADTHDLLSVVDCVVSPLSTIILEAMLHGKPAMCFLADVPPEASLGLQMRHVHFDELYSSPAVLVAKGDKALIDGLQTLLRRVGDREFEALSRAACSEFVTPFKKPFSDRIVELVQELAKSSVTDVTRSAIQESCRR